MLINALFEEDDEGNLDGDKEEYNEVKEDDDASGDDDWCDILSLCFFFMFLLHLWAMPWKICALCLPFWSVI